LTVSENKAWVEQLESKREYVKVILYPSSLIVEGFLKPENARLLLYLTTLAKCARVNSLAAASFLPLLDYYFLSSGVSLSAEIFFTDY
jgi:hypothetical protein